MLSFSLSSRSPVFFPSCPTSFLSWCVLRVCVVNDDGRGVVDDDGGLRPIPSTAPRTCTWLRGCVGCVSCDVRLFCVVLFVLFLLFVVV